MHKREWEQEDIGCRWSVLRPVVHGTEEVDVPNPLVGTPKPKLLGLVYLNVASDPAWRP